MNNLYLFKNSNDEDFIYSGNTGLILKKNNRIKKFLNNNCCGDEELKNYLIYGANTMKLIKRTNISKLSYLVTNKKINNNTGIKFNIFKRGIEYFLNKFDCKKNIIIQYITEDTLFDFSLIKQTVKYLNLIKEKNDIYFYKSIVINKEVLTNRSIKKFLIENNFNITLIIYSDTILSNYSEFKVMENIKEISNFANFNINIIIEDFDLDLIKLYENFKGIEFNKIILRFNLKNYKKRKHKTTENKLQLFTNYFLNQLEKKELVKLSNIIDVLVSLHSGNSSKYLPNVTESNSYILDDNENIYLCDDFINMRMYKVGDINTGINKKAFVNYMDKYLIQRDNSKCKECWAKKLCSDSFYYNSFINEEYTTTNDNKNYCYFQKEIIKKALYIYTSLDKNRIIFENIKFLN